MRRTPLLLAAALTLTTVSIAAAQGGAQTTTSQQAAQRPFVARVVRVSLRGIVLTDTERADLGLVSAKYSPKFKELAESAKPIAAKLRAARQAKDTAAAHAARRELVAVRREGVKNVRLALTDLRSVLTPEQQTTFDKNVVAVRRLLRRRAGQPG